MTTEAVPDGTARTDDPAPNDLGLVVRPIFPGGGSGVPVEPVATDGVVTQVPASNVSGLILAANPARVGFAVRNTSQYATLYLLQSSGGGVASSTNHTVALVPCAYYEDPYRYVGDVIGVWDGVVQPGELALVTEYQP